ncbi:MAG: GIY-YIG nuclease family protein [bacterium]|nr:GIY-YIG nuclease family protein [bacterium]
MFYTYILKSLKDNRTYVGYFFDVQKRLCEHNSGRVKATKNRIPLEILFFEQFETEKEAKKRELWWKSGAGRRKLGEYFEKNK